MGRGSDMKNLLEASLGEGGNKRMQRSGSVAGGRDRSMMSSLALLGEG